MQPLEFAFWNCCNASIVLCGVTIAKRKLLQFCDLGRFKTSQFLAWNKRLADFIFQKLIPLHSTSVALLGFLLNQSELLSKEFNTKRGVPRNSGPLAYLGIPLSHHTLHSQKRSPGGHSWECGVMCPKAVVGRINQRNHLVLDSPSSGRRSSP